MNNFAVQREAVHARSVQEFSVLDLWQILSLRRRTVITGIVLALALSLAVSLATPTKFAAQSSIEINPENSDSIDVSPQQDSAERDYAVTLATQANVMESDTLALQVIQQLNLERVERQRTSFHLFGVHEDSVPLEQSAARRNRMLNKFHRSLAIKAVGGTRILEVRYLDRDPALAAAVVNTLVNDYLEQYFQTRYSATHQASDWLSKQLATLKNDVETSQQRLVDYQKESGILGESETKNVVMTKLEEVNRQLSAAEANRIVKQAVWHLAKTGDPELISSVAGSPFVQGVSTGANPSQLGLLPTLRAQEAQLKADIAQASARVGPSFPKLVQMRSELADLQSSIDSEIRKISARAENDYIAAQNAENMERALFEQQKQEANKLNDSAIQYGILKREVDTSRDLYEGLLGKLKQAGVLAGLRSSNIVVVDPARPASKPSSPNYALNFLLGLCCGTLGGIGVALFQDSTDDSIHSPRDLEQRTGLHTIGVIPRMRNGAFDGQEFREAFRGLRTALLPSKIDASPQTIVVSSAVPGEGKTTVAVNLARALAQQGGRVLLVDADIRRPSVHLQFEDKCLTPGLSEILALASAQVSPTVRDLGGGLHVLTAGSPPLVSPELLGSPRFSGLLSLWRQDYDHILLDTPPVLAFSDAVVLARHAEAVLLVARADNTSSESVLRASELLRRPGSVPVLIVLNAMDFTSPGYARYFGYSYNSRQIHSS